MSIRKMSDSDTDAVLALLNRDKLNNMVKISNVRLFGLEGEDFSVYGEFDEGTLISLITNYKSVSASYFSEKKRDITEAAEWIRNLSWKGFGGRKELIQPFMPFLAHEKTNETHVAVTGDYDFWDVNESELTTMSTEEELLELMNLTFQIDEFEATRTESKDEAIAEAKNNYFRLKDGLLVYLRKEGRIVAMAGSSCETDDYVYISNVATLSDERKKGYATIAVKYLMNEYKRKNKRLCLRYDNPEAATIYHRLGFADQDEALMLIR